MAQPIRGRPITRIRREAFLALLAGALAIALSVGCENQAQADPIGSAVQISSPEPAIVNGALQTPEMPRATETPVPTTEPVVEPTVEPTSAIATRVIDGGVPVSAALATMSAETPVSNPTPVPETVIFDQIQEPAFYGAGSPSVEMRIYLSDIVVRASPLVFETGNGKLRFRVIEYLKGTGPAEIVVAPDTRSRNTTWDDREALLFLTISRDREGSGTSGAQGANAAREFAFSNSHYKNPEGYTIDTLDPSWLPAEIDGIGASGASSNPSFITDSQAPGGDPEPTVSLADLRMKIAWMEGGDGILGYDRCIGVVLNYKKYNRDYEAFYGTPSTHNEWEKELVSGAGQGTLVSAYDVNGGLTYDKYWLTGQDSQLFMSLVVDDDEDPLTGHKNHLAIARPLPAGVYRFAHHVIGNEYMPCGFTPDTRLLWIVTITAPLGTVHEAFFDGVTIGSAVGVDAAHGVLKPKSFPVTEGVNTPTIQKATWEAGRAVVEFEPSLPLEGHHLELIALDGSLSLRLDFDDASETIEGVKRTFVWNVCNQPWVNGDLLMLRIRRSGENLTNVINDGPCGQSP